MEAGILAPVEHPTDWCSQSFPVVKPNSDPLSVRWVTDFRTLNRGLFNFLTNGGCKIDPDFKCLKNVDDFMLYASTLEGLEAKIKKLVKWCRKINLKLSPAKF